MTRIANPIIPGFHPDPSICRVGDDFYLATSSFEYFPGVPLFHSRDLANWQHIGYALDRPSQLPLEGVRPSAGVWAPTLRHHRGRFYLVTTVVGKGGNILVTAEDPAGPWSEPLWFDPDGWDPSLFFDDDGRVYLTRNGSDAQGHFGLVQYEIDVIDGRKLSEPRIVWYGSGGFGVEAPHLYKIGDRYYLMAAEGGTHAGHMVTIGRSDNPWGPFESCPRNPILSHRDHLLHRIQAAGHGDLVDDAQGRWWIVFLGIRNYGSLLHQAHTLGRETFLASVTWDDDGWPVVNNNQPVPEEFEAATPPEHRWTASPPCDDFTGERLALPWNSVRSPLEGAWSLTERPGWLRLHGSARTLDDLDSPTMIARRQQHHNVRTTCLLDYEPQREGEEAGLTVFMAARYHIDIAVGLRDGRRVVLLRRTADDWQAVVAEHVLPSGSVMLRIEANPWAYFLSYAAEGGNFEALGKDQAKIISTEFAGGFTGVFFGLYATGNGAPAATPADFDWFEYEPLQPHESRT